MPADVTQTLFAVNDGDGLDLGGRRRCTDREAGYSGPREYAEGGFGGPSSAASCIGSCQCGGATPPDAPALAPGAPGKGVVLPGGARDGQAEPQEPKSPRYDHPALGSDSDDEEVAEPGPSAPPSSSSTNAGGTHRGHRIPDPFKGIKIDPRGTRLRDFKLPLRAVQPNGFPLTFEVTDIGFLSAFSSNMWDRLEVSSLYKVCYWLQEAINASTELYRSHADLASADLEESLGDVVIFLKRIHRVAVKRYDFLDSPTRCSQEKMSARTSPLPTSTGASGCAPSISSGTTTASRMPPRLQPSVTPTLPVFYAHRSPPATKGRRLRSAGASALRLPRAAKVGALMPVSDDGSRKAGRAGALTASYPGFRGLESGMGFLAPGEQPASR